MELSKEGHNHKLPMTQGEEETMKNKQCKKRERGLSPELTSSRHQQNNTKYVQEDHDGPISLTWANSFANLLLKFQPSSLL